MKERKSVKFSNYTKAREEWYKKECEEILFRRKSKIIIDYTKVAMVTDNQETFLLTIDNPKTTWFQVWLQPNER